MASGTSLLVLFPFKSLENDNEPYTDKWRMGYSCNRQEVFLVACQKLEQNTLEKLKERGKRKSA